MIIKIDKNIIRFVILFVILIFLNGCLSYYYVPNSHNVPLLQDKNEGRVLMAVSGGENFGGAELMGAYSLTRHFGVMANGFFNSQGFYSGGGYFGEIGAGYFNSLYKKIVFETYGGIGWGEITYLDLLNDKSFVNYSRYFIQPSIGFTSSSFDIAVSSRFCWLNFQDVDDICSSEKENLCKSSFLFEPAFTIRSGWEYFKLQCQIGYSTNLNNPTLLQETFNFCIGGSFFITNRDKSKRKVKNHSPPVNKLNRRRNSFKK